MSHIHVPAMYPFPAIDFPGDIPQLRNLAHYLKVLGDEGLCNPLCFQLDDLNYNACLFFRDPINEATDPFESITFWAECNHGIPKNEAAEFRPEYAYHISRSIYEQIGD